MSAQTYLACGGDRSALSAIPLESTFRGVPFDRLVARLRTERSLFDGGIIPNDPKSPWLTVVVVAETAGDNSLEETLSSVALQSCPHVRCIVAPAAGVDQVKLEQFIGRSPLRPTACELWDSDSKRNLRKARYITFLRHGDRLHPSAAAWIACHASSAGPLSADLVAWGELQPSSAGGLVWAQRNPALHRATLLHYPYLRNAFAASSRFVVAYSGDLIQELQNNALHLFQIWLAHQGEPRWIAHPEYFLIRAVGRAIETPNDAAKVAYAGREAQYGLLFEEIAPDLELTKQARASAAPYQLTPKIVPAVVSVVILFRDKPELTLRAVASIAKQSYSGFLELILVNNQSTVESVSTIKAGIAKAAGAISSWHIIDYDKPFNHSRQCNVGVAASLGDVIVFLNNDCEFISTRAIHEMSAWALQPEVASVGVCIRNPATSKEASGIEARLGPINYFDSIVEERSDAAFTPFVRECFGNTFACAAIPRAVLNRIGGLDDVRFPNGYNDVDFVCKTRALGLRHIALGHVKATHAPGQSRDRTDESPQKILVRELYPHSVGGLGELAFDDGLIRLAEKMKVSATKSDTGASIAGATT